MEAQASLCVCTDLPESWLPAYTNRTCRGKEGTCAAICDFQHRVILKSVDSDEPLQPPLRLETPNNVQSVALYL